MSNPSRTRRSPVCLIYNPNAGSAERIEELRQLIERDGRVDLCPTDAPGDAGKLAAGAARDGRRVVIAAGGDGTVSEVVDGLMSSRHRRPRTRLPSLLVIPMGTGNDLVRTLELPDDFEQALALLDNGRLRPLDVIGWTLQPAEGGPSKGGYCVNVVNGGFSAKLKEALTPEIKKTWGPLAYARAAVGSVDELTPHQLRFAVDGGPTQTCEALNVVVANARYAGGGIEVAPQADPSDGQVEVVIIQPGDWLDLAAVTTSLIAGQIDQSKHTLTLSARSRIDLSSEPPMPFNIDGDFVGEGALRINVTPSALHVLVPAAAANTP